MPPKREEEAIAGAILQRLIVQRDTLVDQESRVLEQIETLKNRILQIDRDMEREGGLNRDAGEVIQRLEWEARELAKAGEGHGERLETAADASRESASVLQEREAELSQITEDVARLAARHHSAQRLVEDSRKTRERSEAEALRARDTVEGAQEALNAAAEAQEAALEAAEEAQATAESAEDVLEEAEAARAETQSREAEARAERSEAEGELNTLRAEATALARLLDRDTAEGGQIIDRLQVEIGFEKALGAALADDLRAPEVEAEGPSGWSVLPPYAETQALPDGVTSLAAHVSVPDVLERRMAQIGLVDPEDAPRLQPLLKPGQRLVSLEGDLWRWDGFRSWAEEAPSAAALRLEQLNRLEGLKQQMARSTAKVDGARDAHETLTARLLALTEADQAARLARRAADGRVAEAARALSRAEADRSLAA